jgi:hypothetical protein
MKPEFYRQGKEKSHKWLTGLDADGVIAHTWDPDFIDSIVNLSIPAVICGLDKPKRKACRLRSRLFSPHKATRNNSRLSSNSLSN